MIGAQLALLFFASSVAIYWLLLRKKKKESAEWVPAALVRAYLDRVRSEEREIRLKLFGEDSGLSVMSSASAPLATALSTVTTVVDPNLVKELEALRGQLATSDQRAMEFDRMMNALRAEKAALEEKLKNAGTGAAPAADPAAAKELEELKARLQEYEVIEDDLANLKKFQKENEQLRLKVEGYEKGGAPVTTVIAGTPATAEPKMVVSGAGEKPTMTLVSGGAPAAAAPAEAAPEAAAPAAPETNTNVLQPVTPAESQAAPPTTMEGALAAKNAADTAAAGAPAAEAAPEKSAKQKEEELLSEFEKMLAS